MRTRIIKTNDSDLARKMVEVRGITIQAAWKKVKEINFKSQMRFIDQQFSA